MDPMVMLQDMIMRGPVLLVMWKLRELNSVVDQEVSGVMCPPPLRSCTKVCSLSVCRVSWNVAWLSLVKSQPDRFRRPSKLWSAPWLRWDSGSYPSLSINFYTLPQRVVLGQEECQRILEAYSKNWWERGQPSTLRSRSGQMTEGWV